MYSTSYQELRDRLYAAEQENGCLREEIRRLKMNHRNHLNDLHANFAFVGAQERQQAAIDEAVRCVWVDIEIRWQKAMEEVSNNQRNAINIACARVASEAGKRQQLAVESAVQSVLAEAETRHQAAMKEAVRAAWAKAKDRWGVAVKEIEVRANKHLQATLACALAEAEKRQEIAVEAAVQSVWAETEKRWKMAVKDGRSHRKGGFTTAARSTNVISSAGESNEPNETSESSFRDRNKVLRDAEQFQAALRAFETYYGEQKAEILEL